LLHERAVTPLEGEKECRERTEEAVGQREIDAVKQEGRWAVVRLAFCLILIPLRLKGGGDGGVAAGALKSKVEKSCPQRAHITKHELGEHAFDGREIVLAPDDGQQRIGSRREMSEMIGSRGHNEMEVAIGFAARAFGHDRFQRGRRLFEGEARAGRVSAQLEEA